jgi:hypothetical protein
MDQAFIFAGNPKAFSEIHISYGKVEEMGAWLILKGR